MSETWGECVRRLDALFVALEVEDREALAERNMGEVYCGAAHDLFSMRLAGKPCRRCGACV